MSNLKKLWSDLRGIAKACGPWTTMRWLFTMAANLPTILRERQLTIVDVRMGEGPFTVRYGKSRARLLGTRVFGGIRELWIRDVYGHQNFLKLPENALVVDLGANTGVFTNLVLAHNPTARVVAVEPHEDYGRTMMESARLNGFEDRIRVCRAFIGDFTTVQETDSAIEGFAGAPMIPEPDFLERFGLKRIDLLKCDIEGSEFTFLDEDSRILDISERVAIELHGWGGNARAFVDALEEKGFRLVNVDWDGEHAIALAAR